VEQGEKKNPRFIPIQAKNHIKLLQYAVSTAVDGVRLPAVAAGERWGVIRKSTHAMFIFLNFGAAE
jgi:predicted type IV restriction endonuclease